MVTVCSCEKSVNFYQATWLRIPEESNLHSHRLLFCFQDCYEGCNESQRETQMFIREMLTQQLTVELGKD
jgi:hypothetical protein